MQKLSESAGTNVFLPVVLRGRAHLDIHNYFPLSFKKS